MTKRRLLLLSPYRMPTNHQVYLSETEVAAWLHGYLLLWHPALLIYAKDLPSVASTYDHETPEAGDLFAVPEGPSLYQSPNWDAKVVEAGALSFAPTKDWLETVDKFREAWQQIDSLPAEHVSHGIFRNEESKQLWELPDEVLLLFQGLGYAHLVLDSLYEAMEHEKLLDRAALLEQLQNAIQTCLQSHSLEEITAALKPAADVLLQARETLYSSAIALLDFWDLQEVLFEQIADNAKRGRGMSLLGYGKQFDKMASPLAESLQAAKAKGLLSVMIGGSADGETAFMTLEAQFHKLRIGIAQCRERLGFNPIGYASKTTNFSPQTPSILKDHGLNYVWLVSRDGSTLPSHYAAVVNWPGLDGKSVDALTKSPHDAGEEATYFNLAYTLRQSISSDSTPTLILLHSSPKLPRAFAVWRAASSLGPILGNWQTAEEYFRDIQAGEYAGTTNADEIFLDYLEARVTQKLPDAVSGFAKVAEENFTAILGPLESLGNVLLRKQVIRTYGDATTTDMIASAAVRLADRMGGPSTAPSGWLFFNPSGSTRRVPIRGLEVTSAIPIEGFVKAADFTANRANVVLEIPPLGYAWIPRDGKGTLPKTRLKMVEDYVIRNEFIEAEVDPASGGIRGFRDTRTKVNRIGQQLVFNPGSKMVVKNIRTEEAGPVIARIVSEGTLQDDHGRILADFVQILEMWATRPVLSIEMRIEPKEMLSGSPWQSYFGCRFAWRDERAALLRGINGSTFPTTHNRPQTPDFLEVRSGRMNVCIFPRGLPFHQKPNVRMIDIILIPGGEMGRSFKIQLALDRDLPQATAASAIYSDIPITGVAHDDPQKRNAILESGVVRVKAGKPLSAPSGWLFHIDSPNLLLSSMRPFDSKEKPGNAIVLQFQEISGIGGLAEIRCLRNPLRAARVNGFDEELHELGCKEDAVSLEYSANEMPRICVWFD